MEIFLMSKLRDQLDLHGNILINCWILETKTVGILKFERLKTPIFCSINVSPKKYFQYYSDRNLNKTHQVQKKCYSYGFCSFCITMTLQDHDVQGTKMQNIQQIQLQLMKAGMMLVKVKKKKIAVFNNKLLKKLSEFKTGC